MKSNKNQIKSLLQAYYRGQTYPKHNHTIQDQVDETYYNHYPLNEEKNSKRIQTHFPNQTKRDARYLAKPKTYQLIQNKNNSAESLTHFVDQAKRFLQQLKITIPNECKDNA
jgi:hypothetical protein